MPTNDSPDDGSIDDVNKDSKIYAAIGDGRDGATVDRSKERPELPNLHADIRVSDPTNPVTTFPSDHDYYLVCAESCAGGTHNYFTVSYPLEYGLQVSGSRLNVPSDVGGVRFGHGISSPLVDEAVFVSRHELEQAGMSFEVDRAETTPRVDSVDVISELDDVPLEHEYTDHSGEWVHGYTTLGGTQSFEIFLPIDEAEFDVRYSSIHIPFTENSVTIADHPETRGVTNRQSGLYVKNIHTVRESVVPDVDDCGTVDERSLVAHNYV